MKRIRVLMADDSALMRQTLKRIIAASAELDLVGLARDGEDAVAKARELRPDVVSMDINMPKLDGITALQMILHEKICPVVMVSSLTQQGSHHYFRMPGVGGLRFCRQAGWHGLVQHGRGGRGTALEAESRGSPGHRRRLRG